MVRGESLPCFAVAAMNYEEAKICLLRHGSGSLDEFGNPDVYEDGFLGSLRPFRGLHEQNFHMVMEALLAAGESIHQSPFIDRQLVNSVWSMCSSSRAYGLHPRGMLQRNRLISASETQLLEQWIEVIESTALSLLRGNPPRYAVIRCAEFMIEHGWGSNVEFFVPLLDAAVADKESLDASLIAVVALGKLGEKARSALPTLKQAMERTYSWFIPVEICTQETLASIRDAILKIEKLPPKSSS
jgi:hypothetical protein